MPSLRKRTIAIAIAVAACVAIGVGIGISSKSSSSTTTADASSPTPTPNVSVTTTPTPSSNVSLTTTATPITATPVPTKSGEPPTIMLIGDSITDPNTAPKTGWPTLLQEAYGTSITVLNRGRGGFNTNLTLEDSLPAAEKELGTIPSPLLITVWLGNNDAAIIGGNYEAKHIPVDKYSTNLITILLRLRKASPSSKLVLFTPSVIDNDTRVKVLTQRKQIVDPLDRSNEQAGIYAAATRSVQALMAQNDVSLLDIYSYFMETYPVTTERATMLEDGLHFSTRGHQDVAAQLIKHIEKILPSAPSTVAPVPSPAV